MDTYTITIDGGTTNTRCILWNSSRQRIDEQKRGRRTQYGHRWQ